MQVFYLKRTSSITFFYLTYLKQCVMIFDCKAATRGVI